MTNNMDYKKLITEIIEREGGDRITNTPGDLGGLTRAGMTLNTYNSYKKEMNHPEIFAGEFYKETIADLVDAYQYLFVSKPRLNELPDWIASPVIDFAVMASPRESVKCLQQALHLYPVDGVLGPNTLEHLKDYPAIVGGTIGNQAEQNEVIEKFTYWRIQHHIKVCEHDPSQLKFLDGWFNRAWGFLV